jgi:hypothetical protein
MLMTFVGERLAFGSSDSARALLLDADLKSTVLKWDGVRRPPTRKEFEVASKREAGIAPPSRREQVERAMLDMPMPELAPTHYGIWGDPMGLLWVQTSAPGGKNTDLLALNAQGQSVARLSVQRDMTVYQIGKDYILGFFEDESDEPHLVVYPLKRN